MASRKPRREGRIRQRDDSLKEAGIKSGDLVVVDLTKQPNQDELCAAYTARGKLVVRYFHRVAGGDIRLTTGQGGKIVQIFAPSAVLIFGRVIGIIAG